MDVRAKTPAERLQVSTPWLLFGQKLPMPDSFDYD